jgi:hypothetical protein
VIQANQQVKINHDFVVSACRIRPQSHLVQLAQTIWRRHNQVFTPACAAGAPRDICRDITACLSLLFAFPRPDLDATDGRAFTSARSTGFCANWFCISSSSLALLGHWGDLAGFAHELAGLAASFVSKKKSPKLLRLVSLKMHISRPYRRI